MTFDLKQYFDRLSELIANYGTVETKEGLDKNLNIIQTSLLRSGFTIQRYQKEDHSDVLIAKRTPISSNQWVGIYGHYDVELLEEGWLTDPLKLTQKEGRLFGRGIADNLGILLLRLMAVEQLESNQPCPGIFWVLQGEEEIASPHAHLIFPKIETPKLSVWLEETGYFHKTSHRQRYLILNKNEQLIKLIERLSKFALNDGFNSYSEERPLNKAFGNNRCPFLQHFLKDTPYIAFGPNDEDSNIHRPNESLPIYSLDLSYKQFLSFLDFYV